MKFDSLSIEQNGRRPVVDAWGRAHRGEIGFRRRSVVTFEAIEYLLLSAVRVANDDEFQFEVVALAVQRRRRTVQERVIEMSEIVVLIADGRVVLVVVSRLDRLRAARVQAAGGQADRVQGTVFVHRIFTFRHRFERTNFTIACNFLRPKF